MDIFPTKIDYGISDNIPFFTIESNRFAFGFDCVSLYVYLYIKQFWGDNSPH